MELSRRNFLKGAAAIAGAAGIGALASVGTARADEAEAGTITYDQTIAWDGQYDVVVVGFGAAGASTAIAAADAGASVLLLDKAPLGNEGGNSRYCAQLFVNGRGNYDETLSYYKQLYGDFEYPEDVVEVYAQGIADIADTYAEVLDLDQSEFMVTNSSTGWSSCDYMCPEYPEFVTDEENSIQIWALHAGASDSYMWQNYRQQVVNRADSIDVWLESPATNLIQEPNTKTILGVTVERGGEELNIRALNGVVLTCGGYENNRRMLEDYVGWARSSFVGTAYNTGDGINMAKAAGADLWHMHAIETGDFADISFIDDMVGYNIWKTQSISGSVFLVGGDGYRFLNESMTSRHGHYYNNGTWDIPVFPSKMWVIFDGSDSTLLEKYSTHSTPYQADTITELAEMIGTEEGVLEQTLEDYNSFAEAGYDPVFHRDADKMTPLGDGPYCAVEIVVAVLNTQGGPRRNANAEIVDLDENPIPHLYSAGECGGVTANMYQGGGNMAECLIFGQIAGKNAAVEKDPLDAYVVEAVESNLVYTIGVMNDLAEDGSDDEYDLADNEYVASATGIGGDVVVKVTTDDGVTILDLEVLEENETDSIGGAALEVLVPAIIEAGTTDGIDGIAGATVTSTALFEAIADCLAQATE